MDWVAGTDEEGEAVIGRTNMEKRRATSRYTTREAKRRVDKKRRTRTNIYALVMPSWGDRN